MFVFCWPLLAMVLYAFWMLDAIRLCICTPMSRHVNTRCCPSSPCALHVKALCICLFSNSGAGSDLC